MENVASDETLRKILRRTRVIAVVGVSINPVRPSFFVARYMQMRGFKIVPVNPFHAGKTLLGERIVPSLAEAPDTVDMIDIFRRSEFVPEIVAQGMTHLPNLKTVWMQFGVEHAQAAATARTEGLDVIENRCPKIEFQRLFGELRCAGINTGILSSKLPQRR